jgi:hypothetical protein
MLVNLSVSCYDLGVPIEKGKAMFGFYRRWKNSRTIPSSSTAVNPERLARQILEQARQYAVEENIALGKEFWFQVGEIPGGVSVMHKVSRSLMEQAFNYGLSSSAVLSQRVAFVRLV